LKAMILAAGRGERMRPLTDNTPKPLLSVGGQPLIVWHLQALAKAGFAQVVINTAHLAQALQSALGDGGQWGLEIRFSDEPPGALETAGGIATAQPWLGSPDNEPFLVLNGDVFSDWPLHQAKTLAQAMVDRDQEACLVLVQNPDHHPGGDFELLPTPSQGTGDAPLAQARRATHPPSTGRSYTYSGIGLFRPSLFHGVAAGERSPLAPLLFQAAQQGRLCGLVHQGRWTDVGTPERLAALDQALTSQRDSPHV